MKLSIQFILLIVIMLLVVLNLQQCSSRNKLENNSITLVNALNDSLKLYKDKNNNLVGTISVLQTSSTKDFIELQIKDSQIIKLQNLVSQYKNKLEAGSSVTNALIETVVKLRKDSAPTIVRSDTVRKDSLVYIYSTYQDSLINKWISLKSTMGKDSSNYELKVNNEFSAVIGVDKSKPFVDLILYNPYSTVKSLRTYQVSLPPPKRWGVGVIGGYGVNQDFKHGWFIGAGVSYDFIKL